MYITKLSEIFSNKNTRRLIGQIAALILVLNTEACTCNGGKNNTANLSMQIGKILLIGENETSIDVTFQTDDSGKPAIIGDFKLRVNIVEQKTFTGTTTGSHIKYEEAANDPETGNNEGDISQPFEKLLSEFTNYAKLDPASGIKSFEEMFTLVPAQDAIHVKINFELVNAGGESMKIVEVEWIKSKIVINPPAKFIGEEEEFTLKNLKGGDLTSEDLDKLNVKIVSSKENVSFLLGNTSKSEASLKQIFPDMSELHEEQSTNPITITAHNPEKEAEAIFTIRLETSDATGGTSLLTEVPVKWSETEETKALREKEDKLAQLEAKHTELEQQKQELQNKNDKLNAEIAESKGKVKAAKDADKTDPTKESNVKQAKEALKNTKSKNGEEIKQNNKQVKELEEEIKANEKEQKKLKKEIGKEGENDEDDSNSLPEIVMSLQDRKPTDPNFTIELANNKGKEPTDEQTEKINFWYEVENSTGDISAVTLNHGGQHVKKGDKVNLKSLLTEKVYATFLERLKMDHKHDLLFTIHPGLADSINIIIHLEGTADADKTVTVEWKKEDEEQKKKEKADKKQKEKEEKEKKKKEEADKKQKEKEQKKQNKG
ncbi:MAG: hypothetical protein BGO68_02835 [Candidatus Amoebophilus sp. 36-38]|mgnify:CR=1 FL=1|nr:MAG: hypothetical protein BGO68_02835 [Candidatus Amoebophilus sp. 36-38]